MSAGSGKTVLVTGATSGIGLGITRALLDAGHRVVMAVRRPDAARASLEDMDAGGRGSVLELDLASLASVRACAKACGELDAVVCNAGVQVPKGVQRTADGHEQTFGVNHLGHFALIASLLDRVRTGGRVVFLGSGTHDPGDRVARTFGFRGGRYTSAAALANGDPEPGTNARQAGMDRYATSKLCNIMTMLELADRYSPAELGVFAIDPALVPATGLAREHPAPIRVVYRLCAPILERLPFASTPAQSGAAAAWVATDPSLAGRTGLYFDHRRARIEPWSGAANAAHRADLWRWSEAALNAD